MSSSPKLAAIEAFEYQEPGTVEAATAAVAAESHATAHNGSGRKDTSEDLELNWPPLAPKEFVRDCCKPNNRSQKELADERAKVTDAIHAFAQKTSEYYSRAEIELVHLSLAIAAKILHREAHVDRMLVAALVKVALEKLQHGTSATVRVRPEEVADWNRYFEGNGGGEIRVEVKPTLRLTAHNCILETDLGTTELGLDAQLKEIEQGFFDLLAQRPDSK